MVSPWRTNPLSTFHGSDFEMMFMPQMTIDHRRRCCCNERFRNGHQDTGFRVRIIGSLYTQLKEREIFILGFYCLLKDPQILSDQSASVQYAITLRISKSHLISFLSLCCVLVRYFQLVFTISTFLWRKWELPSDYDRAELESGPYNLLHLQRLYLRLILLPDQPSS